MNKLQLFTITNFYTPPVFRWVSG